MNSNPQQAVNSFEVSPFSPAFYHGLQLGMRNCPPQFDQPIVYNLITIFAHFLLYLTTIFTAPHRYLCCTSLQIDWTSPQSLLAPHHWMSRQSLLHLTTIFAAPHHRSALTMICCTSPQTSLHLQILTCLIETLHLHFKSW